MSADRDEIEFEQPDYFSCECCGARSTKLTRFVHRQGSAFAVYFANFSDSAHCDYVSVLVGFGPWGEDSPPDQRTAFALRIWTKGDRFQVGLVDPDQDGWETEFLGRKLSRDEALVHALKQEAFDLSDHIVECDEPVIRFLESRSGDQPS
ncbi:MAG: hypothetical protein BVN33_00030 [Proteobacteria bacterium ST_bin13]|nr:MAG: hypothetical protein BVN33_00030 [Proteobacteria bacterium ST_bin13]